MPLTLVTTPGASDANSYATVAEANAYNDSVMAPEVWTEADVPTKNRALVTATRLLDAHVPWAGQRAFVGQALMWPRYGVFAARDANWLISHYVIPQEVKNATAELARRLIEFGMPDVASDTAGMKSFKAGPIEVEWEPGANAAREDMIDRYVLDMISHLTVSRSSGGIVVPLIRI